MTAPVDLAGKRFGKLVVLSFDKKANGVSYWLCKCDCGTTKSIIGGNLKRGTTSSCGCKKGSLKHGHTQKKASKTYQIWATMRRRCENKNNAMFSFYGGKGITVCERWKSFENFLADMGEKPDGMSIDRIDNSKGYSPENCRWATQAEQNRNTTRNVFASLNGKTQCFKDWSDEFGLPYSTACYRLYRKLPPFQDAVISRIPSM